MHSVTEVTISCSENSIFGMVIGLFQVKPDVNWVCSSTVVDGGISNKASRIGRDSLFSRQESQMREPLLAVKLFPYMGRQSWLNEGQPFKGNYLICIRFFPKIHGSASIVKSIWGWWWWYMIMPTYLIIDSSIELMVLTVCILNISLMTEKSRMLFIWKGKNKKRLTTILVEMQPSKLIQNSTNTLSAFWLTSDKIPVPNQDFSFEGCNSSVMVECQY